MRYWLFKSEPGVFSFDDLRARPDRTEPWEGVRNYQVRNYLRDEMLPGDLGLFYHSSCAEPGVAGLVRVSGPARPDATAWDPESPYHDPKCPAGEPRWFLVDVAWHADLPNFVSLAAMRGEAELNGMNVLRRGNRLSITPVEEEHFQRVCALGGLHKVPRMPAKATPGRRPKR
jgi:predicted RNA-binding protein with PUA-like domain